VSQRSARAAFLGLSHLGLVSSIAWAARGRPVIGLDSDQHLVAAIQRGDLNVHEPGLQELLHEARASISFSSDFSRLGECALVICARDVPTDDSNTSDLTPVNDLIDRALPHLAQGVTFVMMSQVAPGFTRTLRERICAARPELAFDVYYWVETLAFGDAVRRATRPERLIVGCADPSQPLPEELREGLAAFGCPILPMRYESAELAKTAINLYLIGSVTYSNTLSNLCEAIGADWAEIRPALHLDKRIGPAAYLRPSLGIAGGNLERDLVTLRGLARAHDVDSGYLDALVAANARRFDWLTSKLDALVFAHTARPCLAVWGLTYKANTRSTRNSPALRLIAEVGGRASIRAWDPVIKSAEAAVSIEMAASAIEACRDADGVLVMSDWPEFESIDARGLRSAMRRPLVIDCVGVLQSRASDLVEAGIDYVAMGR
jgi:UDPglucose 6-dehydrogenase